MTQQDALDITNDIWLETATFAHEIVKALRDGKLSLVEGITVSMKGLTFAAHVLTLIQSVQPGDLSVIAHMLENSTITVNK